MIGSFEPFTAAQQRGPTNLGRAELPLRPNLISFPTFP